MTTTDVPRTPSDRLYALLLRTYPAPFRDRFGAGMRYAFSRDHDAALVLALVAAIAGWPPARRAARVDPTIVMREV